MTLTQHISVVETRQDTAHPTGLRAPNFKKVSRNGIGDPYNAYPHAMIWYDEHLYVGTTRANIHVISFRIAENINRFYAWPVERPDNPFDLDLRAQIWRFNPRNQEWKNVFISPMIMGKDGFEVPMTIGFRGITAFQGRSDPAPALYIPTWSSSKGHGPVLLRSLNGGPFEQISEPGLGDPTVSTFRCIVAFKDKIFISPTGTARDQFSGNIPDRLIILVSDDPKKGRWEMACQPHFGDRTNDAVFDMAIFNGHLYAGTLNTTAGCQVWKTDAAGDPPYRWKKVLTHGGYRGKKNEGIPHMFEFNGCLYVGTGIVGGGFDRVRNIGPASAELFRLHPDDSWDLVVGEPRLTPEGLKAPLSGLGPGFNSFSAGYFWRMCVHEGWLYLGTYDSTVWMPYIKQREWPDEVWQQIEQAGGIGNIVEKLAGFDLWRSQNGLNWLPVTRTGLGNPCNYGVRTMASSPFGLFIGAANPFGPKMAVERLSGWHYAPNPRGGLEIWLGSNDFNGRSSNIQAVDIRRRSAGFPDKKDRDPGALCEEQIDEYYGGSGFRLCGLWRYPIRKPQAACENLVEELLSFIPQKQGRLLEINSAKGAATKIILKYFSAENVTGAVQKKEDLKACHKNAAGVSFRVMRLPKLKFKKNTFEHVVCIEGPGLLKSGKKLIKEIYRILKPGGRLVFSDIIFDTTARQNKSYQRKKIADTPEEYRKRLISCGFIDASIYDATKLCWGNYHKHVKYHFGIKLFSKEMSYDGYQKILDFLPDKAMPVRHYVIGMAIKDAPLKSH